MVIHSVMPTEFLLPRQAEPAMSCLSVGNEYLEGYDTPQGFSIARVISTNPATYLNPQFSPGCLYQRKPGETGALHL